MAVLAQVRFHGLKPRSRSQRLRPVVARIKAGLGIAGGTGGHWEGTGRALGGGTMGALEALGVAAQSVRGLKRMRKGLIWLPCKSSHRDILGLTTWPLMLEGDGQTARRWEQREGVLAPDHSQSDAESGCCHRSPLLYFSDSTKARPDSPISIPSTGKG